MAINYIQLAWEQHQADEELERQARIVQARDLYEGTISNALIAELAIALLSGDTTGITDLFNLYATVVDEIADRLLVLQLAGPPLVETSAAAQSAADQATATSAAAAGDQAQTNEPLTSADGRAAAPAWAVKWWNDSGLDELQNDLYLLAVRDGVAYVVLSIEKDYQTGEDIVRPYVHERYTSADIGGTNEGVLFHYANDVLTIGKPPDFVSKRWVETFEDADGNRSDRQRLTLYIPATAEESGRIEKYARDGQEWVQIQDEADTTMPLPWPHPLIVIEFRNTGGKLQGKRATGGQIIMDNLITALISAAGSIALPPLVMTGAYPTVDGQKPKSDLSNVWRLGPRQMLGVEHKGPGQVSIEFMTPGDLSQIIRAINECIKLMAITTGTPSLLSEKLGTQPIAAKLLQQMDIKPVAAAKRVQNNFGNSWSKLFKVAGTLINELTNEKADPEQRVEVVWMPADLQGYFVDEGEEMPVTDVTPDAAPAAAADTTNGGPA